MASARKRPCNCRICRYAGSPIDDRKIKTHIKQYGLHLNEDDIDANSGSEFHEVRFNQSPGNTSTSSPVSGLSYRSDSDSSIDDKLDGEDTANWHEDQGSINSQQSFSEAEGESESDHQEMTDIEGELESDQETTDPEEDYSEADGESENENKIEMHYGWSSSYDFTVFNSDVAVNKIPNSEMTQLEWLCYQFHLFVSHPSMSKAAFTHNLQVQKIIHNDKDNLLPSSYHEARRMVEPFIIKKRLFSACVNDCVIFRNNEKYSYGDLTECPICHENRYLSSGKSLIPRRKFVYVPIGPRLARTYGDTSLAQLVQMHPGSSFDGEQMWDIHHSPVWKEIYSPDGYFSGNLAGISYALELDGVNPFHNVGIRYSMTPIMLTMLNLPRHLRNNFGNINLVGIIPGNGKVESPNFDPYLEILVDELLYLSKATMYSAYTRAPVDIKIKLLNFVLDYPGLSKLFHIHGSGSISGCHWCHVRGRRCDHLDKVIYLSNRSYLDRNDPLRFDTVHFVGKKNDKCEKPQSRTLQSEHGYREAYEKTKNKTQASIVASITGCKSAYILSTLPGHDRVKDCMPDACHTIKDVVQNIMNLVVGNKVNTDKITAAEKKMHRTHVVSRSSSDTSGELQMGPAKKKRKLNKSDLPFQLTREELQIADERATNIKVPLGFGLKASPFISKSSSLKSHDWKQLAMHGILKYCLRGTLEQKCRETLYYLLDCISDMCQESITPESIDSLETKLNRALVLLEMYFPVHLQNITTHILHHIPDGLRRYGPVYGTWMFTYERFNSWICKRVTNMRYPEATAIETFLLHDWCHFMLSSGRISRRLESVVQQEAEDENNIDEGNTGTTARRKAAKLSKRTINSVHQVCRKNALCNSCRFSKYFYHNEIHPVTKRVVSYSAETRERSAAKTISSYVVCEYSRGVQCQKISSNKFLLFGRIQSFLEHKASDGTIDTLACIKWIEDVKFDNECGLWYVQYEADNDARSRSTYVATHDLSNPIVTAVDDGKLWFLSCRQKHYLCPG